MLLFRGGVPTDENEYFAQANAIRRGLDFFSETTSKAVELGVINAFSKIFGK
jgi:hypothetical protein